MTFQGKLIRPQYLAAFRCIGSECVDTCCQGWDVIIDKATYDKYRELPAGRLKSLLDSNITLNTKETTVATHALVTLTESCSCPFLSTERLCHIQQAHGEDYLSTTCAIYPRARNLVDGVLEMSLFMSCPEAARLALLDPNPMQFEQIDPAAPARFIDIPLLDSTDDAFTNNPYRYSGQIRTFVISLLQNRDYPLWQRLIILGLFCDSLNRIVPEKYDDEIPALIDGYDIRVKEGTLRPIVDSVSGDIGVQHQLITLLIDHLLGSGLKNARFLECCSAFKQGIQSTADSTPEQTCLRYAESYANYYQPFMGQHEYIMENYLVNYAFRTIFPFGPQKSIHLERRSIFTEYVLLIVQYAIAKGLLIGMAGHYRELFGPEHCVQLLQSYAKVVEHNLPYLKQTLEFLAACGMSDPDGMAILIIN